MTEPSNLPSVAEALELLEVPQRKERARWLRTYLRRAEERTGRQLLVRIGRGTRRPTYRVDMAEVRRSCPELLRPADRDLVDRALRDVHRVLADMDERLDEIEQRQVALAEAYQRLAAQLGMGRAA